VAGLRPLRDAAGLRDGAKQAQGHKVETAEVETFFHGELAFAEREGNCTH
jgi:hypothetical protein